MSATKTKPAVIVTVHRPELTQKERAQRMAEIKRAATSLIVATMRQQPAR